jgi:hypothetical protein
VISWFLDIYTSHKNSSKFASKLNYKPLLDFLEKETESSAWPATTRKRPSCAQRAPTHVAHAAWPTARGARAHWRTSRKHPELRRKQPAPRTTISPLSAFALKPLNWPVFTTMGSLAVPAHSGAPEAALSGYAGPRRVSTAQLRGRHPPIGRRATMGGGSESGDKAGRLLHGRSNLQGVAPPFRWATVKANRTRWPTSISDLPWTRPKWWLCPSLPEIT